MVSCHFEVVSVVWKNLETALGGASQGGDGVFSTLRSGCCAVHWVHNKLNFWAAARANLLSATKGRSIVLRAFTIDYFTINLRLIEHCSRPVHGSLVNYIGVALSNVQSSANSCGDGNSSQ